MKYLLLISVIGLVGCSSPRIPEVIYIERTCPSCECGPFVEGQPHVLGLPQSTVALVEMDDGNLYTGTIKFIPKIKFMVTSLEPTITLIPWESIKTVTILSPTNSLPEDWQELPGVRIWKEAEQKDGGDSK